MESIGKGTEMRTVFILLTIAVMFFHCQDFETVVSGTAKTERTNYMAGEYIKISVSTTSDSILIFTNCCASLGLYIDRFEVTSWSNYPNWRLPCSASCPPVYIFALRGKPFVDSLRLSEPGTYRFRIPFWYSAFDTIKKELVTNLITVY
jgi:hypothetical protein